MPLIRIGTEEPRSDMVGHSHQPLVGNPLPVHSRHRVVHVTHDGVYGNLVAGLAADGFESVSDGVEIPTAADAESSEDTGVEPRQGSPRRNGVGSRRDEVTAVRHQDAVRIEMSVDLAAKSERIDEFDRNLLEQGFDYLGYLQSTS